MKKLIFVAMVLAITLGFFSTTQAFWGFSKKVEVKSEQAKMAAIPISALKLKGESEYAKIDIRKEGTGFSLLSSRTMVKTNTNGVLTTEIIFGLSKVNLTVKTTADTKVYRHYDGRSTIFGVAEIAVGDNLSIEGSLDATADSLTVIAQKIKDFSAQGRDAKYSGTIKTINTEAKSFLLDIPSTEKDLTVLVTASTIISKSAPKGQAKSLPIDFSGLKVGDLVKSAIGIVNTQTMQLIARSVLISERDIQIREINNVFAEIVSIDMGNSMRVKTTAGVFYIVSFRSSGTIYNKWTISRKYSGVKDKLKTDGVAEVSTLGGLALANGNKVWISGTLDLTNGTVVPSLVEKEFYK